MTLIDTHCHLTHGRLLPKVDQVLHRARQAGLAAMICAASDLDESRASLGLAHRHPDVFATAGVHPHEAKSAPADYLDQLRRLAADPKNVAIGEIGLDYHYDFSPRDVQRRVFEQQLALAAQLEKPIVIHTREAFDDTMAIIQSSGAPATRIVFHSFTENGAAIRRALDLGATISFSGIVTFARSADLRAAARLVPLDRLLIETDAPFLSPEPVRKIRDNEPAHVQHIAAHLDQLFNLPPNTIARQTTLNAIKFFRLPLVDTGRQPQ